MGNKSIKLFLHDTIVSNAKAINRVRIVAFMSLVFSKRNQVRMIHLILLVNFWLAGN
jgi:hypothetical protein